EVLERRRVLRPAGRGPQEEELLERELALEDVALGEAPLTLEVERRDDLPVQDEVLQVRGVLGERVDDGVAELLLLVVPAALQVVRRVLDEAREDVLARRRDGRIRQARYDDVDIGARREAPVLRLVVRLLHVRDGRRDGDRAAEVRAFPGQ